MDNLQMMAKAKIQVVLTVAEIDELFKAGQFCLMHPELPRTNKALVSACEKLDEAVNG